MSPLLDDGSDGVVFGVTVITASAGAAMDGQSLNAALFGNVGDGERIASVGTPASSNLQGDRYGDCADHGFENVGDQFLIA